MCNFTTAFFILLSASCGCQIYRNTTKQKLQVSFVYKIHLSRIIQTFCKIYILFYTALLCAKKIQPTSLWRISVSAFWLLVWQRTILALHFSASVTAQWTILWETVLVNKISKSGHPIFLFSEPFSLVKIFALHP